MRKWIATSLFALLAAGAWADGGVTFNNLTEGENALPYQRIGDPGREAAKAEFMAAPATLPAADFFDLTQNVLQHASRGMPGIALIDYDNDGDLDIYAPNGPDTPNSLYANQFVETGAVSFIDVAAQAGVEATEYEATGVCYGDIDNDGDSDLYVLTTGAPNYLFENQGDGTFIDITEPSNSSGPVRYPTACAFADFDGDSYLDLVIANTFTPWTFRGPFIPGPNYENFDHNVLMMNQGDNTFVDTSNAAGLESVSNMNQPGTTGAALSWVVTAFDYDLDGDVDILFGDNQGPPPVDEDPLQLRGYLRLYANDGNANFTEMTEDVGLDIEGGWMGIDTGDLNCDGRLDFFGTNLGWAGSNASRHFLQRADGTFNDPGVGDLQMTPFGWGVSIFDYDNDADSDVIYHGGLATITGFLAGNGGVVLQNAGNCSGVFNWDADAVPFNHRLRTVHGVAAGDLNQDGFEDLVTISSENVTPAIFLPQTGPPFFINPSFGSPFEPTAFFEATHAPFPAGSWTRLAPADDNGVVIPAPLGDVLVELNSADNGNNWVDFTLLGTAGLIENGRSNRNGFGATVFFTPDEGRTSARPIVGGSSFGSQDAPSAGFGLGAATQGTVVVQWDNGTQNRLADVQAGERLVLPEVPCDFATSFKDPITYFQCVQDETAALVDAGLMDEELRERYIKGALAPCDPDSGVNLCLEDGRFKVEINFVGLTGFEGQARVIPYGSNSGIFWFFNPDTIEVHLKMVDACDFNDHYWVFAGASTDVEYSIFVTDLETQEIRGYFNDAGNSAAAITDTSAFATCP